MVMAKKYVVFTRDSLWEPVVVRVALSYEELEKGLKELLEKHGYIAIEVVEWTTR
jgi:hypothetical protein